MIPRRRYRIFVIFALIIVFLLYRASQSSDWDSAAYTRLTRPQANPNPNLGHSKKPFKHHDPDAIRPPSQTAPPEKPRPRPPVDSDDAVPLKEIKLPALKTSLEQYGNYALPTEVPPPNAPKQPAGAEITEPIHWKDPPGAMKTAPPLPTSTTSRIHWIKVPEQFPIDESKLILLPKGDPLAIPRIQHVFPSEAPEAREKRLKRQAAVRDEMVHAWSGYRKYAWMHDELRPVTNGSNDPFAGWAASLVDALDTLWIMGLKDEFDEAAKAVAQIDFTYSHVRKDIPVFETIIRYLGGLVAAFDLSGGKEGKYHVLLDKAIELAEILMGVFDTPNRMPILYYNWEPEFASQPHRASIVSVAELSSMQLEFTRLAQLTGKQKYYDAVARITDEMEDLQIRGTTLEGIFPERLDASGCNQTKKNEELEKARLEQAKMLADQAALEEHSMRAAADKGAYGEPVGYTGDGATTAPAVDAATLGVAGGLNKRQVKVDSTSPIAAPPGPGGTPDPQPTVEVQPGPEEAFNKLYATSANRNGPWGADGSTFDWQCPKQGLTPGGYGIESYSMGGSQDSAYEYFPKQFLLLGGLERKYRGMHLNTIAAVKKWLLYRPMVPGERDILFSAKATTMGHPAKDLTREYEVTHLTCFLGGMFGLGGKIFEVPEDVEIARKLTDGCVWAYESTASGIMPEGATVVPCQSMKSCPWNETVWYQHLDPWGGKRDEEALKWDAEKEERARLREQEVAEAARRKAEAGARVEEEIRREEANIAEERRKMAELNGTGISGVSGVSGDDATEMGSSPAKNAAGSTAAVTAAAATEKDTEAEAEQRHRQNADLFGENADPLPPMMVEHEKPKAYPRPEPGVQGTKASPLDAAADKAKSPLAKRAAVPIPPPPPPPATVADKLDAAGPPITANEPNDPRAAPDTGKPLKIEAYRRKSDKEVEDMLNINGPVPVHMRAGGGSNGGSGVVGQVALEEQRPLTHKEFVEGMIKSSNIPPGFVTIHDRRYILRPEAIESVWYMYRITGDAEWMEKGWRMWQAVVKATRTQSGHSAIDNVLTEKPDQVDSMESFWFAETLKYFYLLFSTPDVISLDEWVLNTEAHPFRRPVPPGGKMTV